MDDLISRQAAIEVADAVWCVTGDKNVAKVWDQIKDLPTADVAPVVHGRWEEKEVTDDLGAKVITEWQSCKCSVCGKYLTTPYMYFFTGYAYCPNCGSKNDEV